MFMFTGLIEDVGEVYRRQIGKSGGRLILTTRLPLEEIETGSSVAVNGACLTVIDKAKGRFAVDVSPETLRRTNLRDVRPGDPVNLERPLRLSDRLGGHLVTGHVDGVAVVKRLERKGKFTFFSFRILEPENPLLVPKGSIAVDGISLTVNDCDQQNFSVAIIPFTVKHTNLRGRKVGDTVNIEIDIISKYVQRLLESRRPEQGTICEEF